MLLLKSRRFKNCCRKEMCGHQVEPRGVLADKRTYRETLPLMGEIELVKYRSIFLEINTKFF